jgi:hypothetical protein
MTRVVAGATVVVVDWVDELVVGEMPVPACTDVPEEVPDVVPGQLIPFAWFLF